MAPARAPEQRLWKYGEAEKRDFAVAAGTQDAKQQLAFSRKFISDYPDSEFHDFALILESVAYDKLKNIQGQVDLAVELVKETSAEPAPRLVGFVQLSTLLSPYVLPTDAALQSKLTDLSKWVGCGRVAFAAVPAGGLGPTENTMKCVLDRTAGFVALMRQDYSQASALLLKAAQSNPQDVLTYLWLSETAFLAPNPDLDIGVFYLARWVELAPQVSSGAQLLKQEYVIAHGSDKGLKELRVLARSDTIPSPGFTLQPAPKKEKRWAATVAAAAIIGLLAYAAVRNPGVGLGIGASMGQASGSTRMLVFGGSSHQTYLGCLSCSQYEQDSILNAYGTYGSRYAADSIWNHFGSYGSRYSAYSACNPYASDPPVIVDEAGSSYGRLTVNRYNAQIGVGAQLYDWLVSVVCTQ